MLQHHANFGSVRLGLLEGRHQRDRATRLGCDPHGSLCVDMRILEREHHCVAARRVDQVVHRTLSQNRHTVAICLRVVFDGVDLDRSLLGRCFEDFARSSRLRQLKLRGRLDRDPLRGGLGLSHLRITL